jgi:hypothetical protein
MMHSIEDEPEVFDVNIVKSSDIIQKLDIKREKTTQKKRAVKKIPVPGRKPVIVKRSRRPVD